MIDEMAGRIPTREPNDTDPRKGRIANWINETIREASRRHSWTFLRQRWPISLASGDAALFDFPGEPIDPSGRLTVTRSDGEKNITMIDRNTADRSYLSTDTGEPSFWVLQIKSPTTDPGAKKYQAQLYPPITDAAYTLTVDGWFYLDRLPDPDADNRWTIDHPFLVMEGAMVKALAFKKSYSLIPIVQQRTDAMLQDAIMADMARQSELISYLRPQLGGRQTGSSSATMDPYNRGGGWGPW